MVKYVSGFVQMLSANFTTVIVFRCEYVTLRIVKGITAVYIFNGNPLKTRLCVIFNSQNNVNEEYHSNCCIVYCEAFHKRCIYCTSPVIVNILKLLKYIFNLYICLIK